MPGPVPSRFWQDRQNRRNYMLWLAHRLRYRRMEDLYGLTVLSIQQNHGHGVLNCYWNASPAVALRDCFP